MSLDDGQWKSVNRFRVTLAPRHFVQCSRPKLAFNGLIAVGGKLPVLTDMGDLVLVHAVFS